MQENIQLHISRFKFFDIHIMATPATATLPSVSNGQSAPKPLAPPTAAGLVPTSVYKHLFFLNLIHSANILYS